VSPGELRRAIEERARGLGFSLVGVTGVLESAHMGFYRSWLAAERHGEMAYLAREDSVARREDLSLTMEGARSVILVAHEYAQEDPPGVPADASRGVIARYARGSDYHDVVKDKLKSLLVWLDGRIEGGVAGRPYVDTGPILERELAQRAGLGWFGRNTMLINPRRGSYFFIGLLLVDVELPADEPFTADRCGTCRACLDACPTGALLGRDATGAPVIDARRCISYLTIELRGPIPAELREPMGNRVFGCDICQEVCPFNRSFAAPTREPAYAPSLAHPGTDGPQLVELLDVALDEDAWRAFTRRSPMRRAGRAGLARNVCVALGNWGSPDAVQPLLRALADTDALVRGHAAWALGRVGTAEAAEALRARSDMEEDGFVRTELAAAL
jgi:epoxyqueuosine reductase